MNKQIIVAICSLLGGIALGCGAMVAIDKKPVRCMEASAACEAIFERARQEAIVSNFYSSRGDAMPALLYADHRLVVLDSIVKEAPGSHELSDAAWYRLAEHGYVLAGPPDLSHEMRAVVMVTDRRPQSARATFFAIDTAAR